MIPEQGKSNGSDAMNAGKSIAPDQHHDAQDLGTGRRRAERTIGYEVPVIGSPQPVPSTIVDENAPEAGRSVSAQRFPAKKRRPAGYLADSDSDDVSGLPSDRTAERRSGKARLRTAVVAAGALSLAAAAVALAGWKRK